MRNRSHYVAGIVASISVMLPLTDIVPPFLAVAAIAYAGLAIRVTRSAPHNPNNIVSFFLFLMAGLVGGSAFSYGADDAVMYGIGRVMSFFSAGFASIAFFVIYREYTVGRPGWLTILVLAIIPMATTGLALTNPLHNMIWTAVETEGGLQISNITDHYWYNHIYAPFTYRLIGYSVLALIVSIASPLII